MKTAGIITYWNTNDNYGTVLQNYALQSYLKDKGINPILIRERFVYKENKDKRILRILKKYGFLLPVYLFFFPVKRLYIKLQAKKNIKYRKFNEFKKNIKYTERIYTSFDDLCAEQNNYDLYIAGSDQIWSFQELETINLSELEKCFKIRFFDFANGDAKKISCAVSFGACNFRKESLPMLKNHLNKFDLLTIREQSGIEFCNSLGVENACLQNDPTILFNANFYRNIYKTCPYKKKYVLLFLLNNSTNFSIIKLKKWAKNLGLDVIYINGNTSYLNFNCEKKTYATIPEWLALIDNAEYVFTNSFHGTMFSLIFNKKFMTIEQTKKFKGQNPRIYSVLNQFNLNSRIFTGDFDLVTNDINWDLINKTLLSIQTNSPFVKWINNYIFKEEE